MAIETVRNKRGQVIARYTVNEQGQRDGWYEAYYDGGRIALSGEYRNGQPYSGKFSGTMTWGPYKDVEWEGSYKEGKKEEITLRYLPEHHSRFVTHVLHYKDGMEDETGYEWVDEDLWEGQYVNGIKEGVWRKVCADVNSGDSAYVRGPYRTYEHGILEGEYKEYLPAQPEILLPEGNEIGTYHNGEKEGTFKRTFSHEEYLYEPTVGGETKLVYTDITGTYRKGRIVQLGDRKITYDRNGDAYLETQNGTYLNGKKNGIWTEVLRLPSEGYTNNPAEMILSGEYRDGKMQGIWKGKGGFITFKDDKCDGKIQCSGATSSGYRQVSQTGQYKDGKFDGTITTTKYGTRIVEFFKNDKRTGYEEYVGGKLCEKGKVSFNGTAEPFFDEGKSEIAVELYDENGTLSETKTVVGRSSGHKYEEYDAPEYLVPGTKHIFYNPDGSIRETKYVSKERGYRCSIEISEKEYREICKNEEQEQIRFEKKAAEVAIERKAEGKQQKEKIGKSKLKGMLEAASKGKRSPQKPKLPPVNGGNGGNGM